MSDWPSYDTRWETLLSAFLSPDTTERQEIARAELLRRLGSEDGIQEVLAERAALQIPIGLLGDWSPARLRPLNEFQGWDAFTENGSRYRILRSQAENLWFLEANRTRPNPFVRELNGRQLIGRPSPFPPKIGQPMAIPLIRLGTIRRTSRVISVKEICAPESN